jgi:hypothetical protein
MPTTQTTPTEQKWAPNLLLVAHILRLGIAPEVEPRRLRIGVGDVLAQQVRLVATVKAKREERIL